MRTRYASADRWLLHLHALRPRHQQRRWKRGVLAVQGWNFCHKGRADLPSLPPRLLQPHPGFQQLQPLPRSVVFQLPRSQLLRIMPAWIHRLAIHDDRHGRLRTAVPRRSGAQRRDRHLHTMRRWKICSGRLGLLRCVRRWSLFTCWGLCMLSLPGRHDWFFCRSDVVHALRHRAVPDRVGSHLLSSV